MAEISIRELRNHGGEVIERVARGEQLTVTRDGHGVAELRPLPRPTLSARNLNERWSRLPPVDLFRFRQDLDLVLDPGL